MDRHLRSIALFASIASLVTGVLVLTRSRYYIELADQSLYLLMADEPRAAIRSGSGYHVLLAPMFVLVGESIVQFRLLRAVIDIGVDVWLGASVVRYLRWRGHSAIVASRYGALAITSTVTLAGFSVWIYAVNGFGYDQLGGILFTILVALVLRLVASEPRVRLASISAMSIGAVLFLGAIVRWTAAVMVTALLLWILIERFGVRETRRLTIFASVGAIASAVLVHLFIFDLATLSGGIASGTSDISRDTHSIPVLLGQYVLSLRAGLGASVGTLVAVAATALVLHQQHRVPKAIPLALVGSGFVMFGANRLLHLANYLEANAVGTILALTGAAVWLGHLKTAAGRRNDVRNVGLTATLVCLPVLLAAGTYIPIFLTALPLASLWIACLWIVVPEFPAGRGQTAAGLIGLVMISAMPLLVWQGLTAPARTTATDAPVEVERGRFDGLLVDDGTRQLLHDLEDLRVQLEPNPTVLTFWARPIVPFALEGTGLGFPWYNSTAKNAAAQTISGACLEDGDTPTGQVVIVTVEDNPRELGPIQDSLLDCGIAFPADFEFVQTIRSPIDGDLSVYVRTEDG